MLARPRVSTCDTSSHFHLTILPAMVAVVWTRRLFVRNAPPRSNLSMPRTWVNEALYALTSREATWVGDERVSAARRARASSAACRRVA